MWDKAYRNARIQTFGQVEEGQANGRKGRMGIQVLGNLVGYLSNPGSAFHLSCL